MPGPPFARITSAVGAVLVALWVVAAFAFQSMAADGDARESLLRKLERVAAFECEFREEKVIPLLTAPVVSEGMLYYDRRGLLARHARRPFEGILVVTPLEIVYEDSRTRWTQGVGASAVLRDVTRAWLLVLQGQLPAMERLFHVEFRGTEEASDWTLTLRPKDESLAAVLSLLRVQGDGSRLVRVETESGSGERSILRFTAFRERPAFSSEERRTLFLDATP